MDDKELYNDEPNTNLMEEDDWDEKDSKISCTCNMAL
jgi:hypothetical protein